MDIEKYKEIINFAELFKHEDVSSMDVRVTRMAIMEEISLKYASELNEQLTSLKNLIIKKVRLSDVDLYGGDDYMDDMASSVIAKGRDYINKFLKNPEIVVDLNVQESFSYIVPSCSEYERTQDVLLSNFVNATSLIDEHPKSLSKNEELLEKFKRGYNKTFAKGINLEVEAMRMRESFSRALYEGDERRLNDIISEMTNRDKLWGNIAWYVDKEIIEKDESIKVDPIRKQLNQIRIAAYEKDAMREKREDIIKRKEDLCSSGVIKKIKELNRNYSESLLSKVSHKVKSK